MVLLRGRLDGAARRAELGAPCAFRRANGASHPEPSAYADKFAGRYSHRTIDGGIGHNLRQEAPEGFADAVLEVVGGS
jgi:hypothetical protein